MEWMKKRLNISKKQEEINQLMLYIARGNED